jgi:hypothetical protein
MFCATCLIFGGTEGIGSRFIFCAPGLIFGGTDGVRSHFHVLRFRTNFRRYRGHRGRFSFFALPNPFSTVSMVSGPIFMFCTPGITFGCTEGVGSRFLVMRSRTRFRRYRACRVPFSCFALPNPFSEVPTASGPVFMFCAPGIYFVRTEGVWSRIHVLAVPTPYRGRLQTHCRRYRGRRVPVFAVLTASGPIFKFCAPGLIFGGTEGAGSRFHILRSWTHFRWYRGRRVPLSFFALSYTFSEEPRASGPVLMFCASRLIFGGIGGVGSRFQVVRSHTRFRRYRRRLVPFSYFALPD